MMSSIALLISLACTAPGQAAAETETRQTASMLTVTPILRADKSGDMSVHFELQNTSEVDFRYFGAGIYTNEVGTLDISLVKGGKPVPLVEHRDPIAASEGNVFTLKPRESIQYEVSLRNYGVDFCGERVPVGDYDLRVKYSIHPRDAAVKAFGISVVDFDELAAIIDLVDSGGRVKAPSTAHRYYIDVRRLFPSEFIPVFERLAASEAHSQEARDVAAKVLAALRRAQREEANAKEQPSREKAAGNGSGVELQAVPVIRADKSGDMNVRFELKNAANTDFRYLGGDEFRGSLGELEIALFRNGKSVPPLAMIDGVRRTRENVFTLKRKESLEYTVSLRRYGIQQQRDNLPPGRYELRAKYSMPPDASHVDGLGLTPLEFDEIITWVDLVDTSDDSTKTPWPAEYTQLLHKPSLSATV